MLSFRSKNKIKFRATKAQLQLVRKRLRAKSLDENVLVIIETRKQQKLTHNHMELASSDNQHLCQMTVICSFFSAGHVPIELSRMKAGFKMMECGDTSMTAEVWKNKAQSSIV